MSGIEIKSPKDILRHIAKLKELRVLGEIFKESQETAPKPNIDFPYNKWSLYIRLVHLLYVPLYTSIISEYFAEFYYIDLFAGSGIGILKPEGDYANMCKEDVIPIGGSPLIAMCFATKRHFTKLILVEQDTNRAELLKKRVSKFIQISQEDPWRRHYWPCSSLARQITSEKVEIRNSDANIVINKIMEELEDKQEDLYRRQRRGIHAYILIDPEGMEFKRKSLDRILTSKVRSDIIELFNTYGVIMQASKVIREGYDDKSLTEFLGPSWEEFIKKEVSKSGRKLEELKHNELADLLVKYRINTYSESGRIVERLPIHLSKKRTFDLLISSRRTKGGNPYFKAFRSIARYVEEAGESKYKIVDEFIHYICTGKLPGLLKYIIENPEDVIRKYGTMRRYGERS